jgi:Uncharacterized protein conserved in bacteria (DUF2252)
MNIVEATQSYETWLGRHVALVESDIARKHDGMQASAFSLLRATYYRWIELWPKACPELSDAPKVLGVGDLHIENFGTWRDSEARLVWGINDFDEACGAPYTNDLVRLAASVIVAVEAGALTLDGAKACDEILSGYTKQIASRAADPFVLEEDNGHLRALAMTDAKSPDKFWKKLADAKATPAPSDVKTLLNAQLPHGTQSTTYARRSAGMGGLGLPRFVALGTHCGGYVAREAKARAPRAATWLSGGAAQPAELQAVLAQAVRAPDPFLYEAPRWIVRRLAPHCERVALEEIEQGRQRREVLHAMGREAANVHWGDRKAAARIVKDLAGRKQNWLHRAALRMADATMDDWKTWRKR